MLFEKTAATPRQLRQFAWALVAASVLFVALRIWRQPSAGLGTLVAGALGFAMGIVGVAAPRRIKWLFSIAMTVTFPIGVVVSELMLAILYFGVITPMALVARLAGRDRLRSIEHGAATYWITRRQRNDPARYFRES